MLESKLNLLIKNSTALEDAKSSFGMGTFKRCNALNLTLRNIEADIDKINKCISIIKGNSSIFSNFRGNNLLTTAVNLSMKNNPEESFYEIMDIYEKLKSRFFSNEFLVLAAQTIYNYKEDNEIDSLVINTRKAYDLMKENHLFLTGYEDISSAALIATTSKDLGKTFKDMEECYSILRKNGFTAGNNLQSLTHILSLFEGSPEEKCEKVILLNKTLKRYSIKLKSYALPILGVVALTNSDYENFANELTLVTEKLAKHRGFGIFSLNSIIRNMIAASLISLESIENDDSSIKNKLIETTNSISLNVVIIMQIAAASAASAAAAASAASN